MDLIRAMAERHSVRQYDGRALSDEARAALQAEIEACNNESGLHIQLVCDEPTAFGGGLAKYGKFEGVVNYLALVGPAGPALEERCGYFGERLVLFAQALGLNTCWVALTVSKGKARQHFEVAPGEKLCMIIALGYGKTAGVRSKSKEPRRVARNYDAAPQWFKDGIDAALLAPTALNQQKFTFTWEGEDEAGQPQIATKAGLGSCTKIDLGIAKYHFELGATKPKLFS